MTQEIFISVYSYLKASHLLNSIFSKFSFIALVFVIFFSTFTLKSEQWDPIGPCYNTAGCVDNLETKQMVYMNCTITVVYHRIVCTSGVFYQIDDITFLGPCPDLFLYLHPNGQTEPDADNYFLMLKDVYKMLFDDWFSYVKNNYICPTHLDFTYWWPGSCSMACETVFANGVHDFKVKSCQLVSCCGKRISYCYNQQTHQVQTTDFTYWVSYACPAQAHADYTKCPTVGSYVDGMLVTAVYATYCKSTCFDN